MPQVRTDVLDISFDDLGQRGGDPVVLVHGWPDAARSWWPLVARLVEAGYRVIVPDLRGSGGTRFHSGSTVRDGTASALTQDLIELVDGLDIDRFSVVGHDWGARVAYTAASLHPRRVTSIAALALAYQPGGRFVMPSFEQARNFWYQWLMYVDDGVRAVHDDPVDFALTQWQTWSPAGWFDRAEFEATAATFRHPDWVAITLNAYRSRFLAAEPVDERYADQRAALAAVDHVSVPTLMIQGGADTCDPPSESAGQEGYFDLYERVVIPGVGHFPHREAPTLVGDHVVRHLARTRG